MVDPETHQGAVEPAPQPEPAERLELVSTEFQPAHRAVCSERYRADCSKRSSEPSQKPCPSPALQSVPSVPNPHGPPPSSRFTNHASRLPDFVISVCFCENPASRPSTINSPIHQPKSGLDGFCPTPCAILNPKKSNDEIIPDSR